ncbi:MAG: DPP IV N-terminal domain-containing protein [Pseudomonadota bacterium]
MRKWTFGLAAVLALGGSAMAADEGPQKLTLERLFASPDLAGPQPRAMKLSPDGKLLTLLKNRPDDRDRYDLWARDTATGAERMLVDSKKVGSGAELTEAEKMQRERARIASQRGIVAYDWSPDGKSILVPLDGDLYLATPDGKVTRLTNTPGGELNPTISPDGGYVSFVRDQNLFVQPLGGGAAKVLTSDGAGTVHWGEAEFVAQEEMDRRTGYWWSPQDKLIAVERFDEAPVGVVTRAAIGAEGTKVYDQRYPAAGTPNVKVELYVIDPATGAKVKVDLGSDPDIYLARVNWTPDGKTLLVQRENRAQTQLDMLSVDPATGKAKIWFSEKSGPKSWINLGDDYRVLKDGSLIWKSERDGYGHLYHFAKGKWTQLTSGKWVVTDLTGVDEVRGRLYFLGNKDDVLEQQLYSVDIARPNVITRLTERGWWNGAAMDKTASRLIVTRSNPNQPPQSYLADANGKRIAWINENAVQPGHPYYPYLAQHRTRSFGTIKAVDGTTLYYEMITPKMEPGKKYPVFFQHYGGPHSQTVTRGWESPMEQYIVDQGYIFFQIDNRGSANRGTAYEDQIWRAMGTVEVEDQLAGAKWLKAQDFVDGDRIGIYGWSYGGYMTLKMLEANPGVYAAGVAGAPVTKWDLYDTHYTERYMGTDPKGDDAKAYAGSNAMDNAARISDPLLLIHGMADDNVVFENSTAFAAKMQAKNRPFEMMFYPGKTHAAGRDIHVWTTIFAYFDRTVKNKTVK